MIIGNIIFSDQIIFSSAENYTYFFQNTFFQKQLIPFSTQTIRLGAHYLFFRKKCSFSRAYFLFFNFSFQNTLFFGSFLPKFFLKRHISCSQFWRMYLVPNNVYFLVWAGVTAWTVLYILYIYVQYREGKSKTLYIYCRIYTANYNFVFRLVSAFYLWFTNFCYTLL